jgi:hypothetical protein
MAGSLHQGVLLRPVVEMDGCQYPACYLPRYRYRVARRREMVPVDWTAIVTDDFRRAS